ncbi:MAG: M48 family metalloprotease [Elusimicrobiota bacterium]
MKKWKIKLDGNIHGPVDSEKIKQFIQEEKITSTTEISLFEKDNWMLVSTTKEFGGFFDEQTGDMKCPNCPDHKLETTFTKQGVEIDVCKECGGIWLDKGEIFHFVAKNPQKFHDQFYSAIKEGKLTSKKSPRTGKNMKEIKLLDGDLLVDFCPVSKGLWFDRKELAKLTKHFGKEFNLEKDQLKKKKDVSGLPRLPSLFLRSTGVLIGLYALVVLFLIIVANYTGLSAGAALIIGVIIVAVQFLLGPFITDIVLKWFYSVRWVRHYSELPDYLAKFIENTAAEKNMKTPLVGIIQDNSPNAFTYGHTPNNARIVITRGILKLLQEDEVKGVVAHEIGHAKHWDMAIMTAAQLVPLIMYYIYRTAISMKTSNRQARKFKTPIIIGSYIVYIISEYMVLWLSRIREYYADRFAGNVTRNPNSLASALVKIGYGMAGKDKETEEKDKDSKRNKALDAVGSMGIFDPESSQGMAVASTPSVSRAQSMGKKVDKKNLKGAMRWDLWNPWAKYYEINSSHPLIAKRLNHLSSQSRTMGKPAYINFDEKKPESYWDEFFVDLFIKLLPGTVFIGFSIWYGITQSTLLLGAGLAALGIANFLKLVFSYQSDFFAPMSVVSLLKKVKVSAVRPVPCKVEGTLIGRGVPGLIWSEDFIMQDETGIIFVDYKQPLPLWDFFFGLLKGKEYKNKEVEIKGWYRRFPVPNIEIRAIRLPNGKKKKCYTYDAKLIISVLLYLAGMLVIASAIF